ncbi:unnamed protein product [Pneumocystis jirovecii]|uniref:Anaphase-promoting complex subunit 4 WD40 domain-containing protein n=2 Tax=Pneumocystis jirovecii TaxID=42068 RepID=L0PBU6_PNEJI|nr:uncharacterized protein T551_03272 [Pneumocystis jirovecii RU7]KTW26810.1 hypothetical protein T551_03272 [Pneumocystis jirovecii RU7]CCJ29105.1 unnamed protein product [Pneumocystis jirovecii]
MALVNYASSDENEDQIELSTKKSNNHRKIIAAPDISLQDTKKLKLTQNDLKNRKIMINIPYEDLSKPVQGPINPFNGQTLNEKTVITGHVEEQGFSDATFRDQYRTFNAFGYARDPSIQAIGLHGPEAFVGDLELAMKQNGESVLERKFDKQRTKDLKKMREKEGDLATVYGENTYKGPWAKYKHIEIEQTLSPPDTDGEDEDEIPVSNPIIESQDLDVNTTGIEKTTFHGESIYDYQGRTYIHVPQDLDINLSKEPGQQECFVPKKLIHTWEDHTKTISSVRFFPRSGHLMLSGSMDSKIKLWDVYHDRSLLRTYFGHSTGVRDITFTNDGRKFLSASYDRMIKLWDTETGQCISRFTTGKIPYVVKFNPDHDKQNEFLTGMSDKKIVQFDINSGKIIQEYDHHLGAVNTITFIDENRRFITTSDDKSLRAWEYGIPVPIKYIAEPYMHSMPSVALHPSGKYVACQSLDNQIIVFSVVDKFRQRRHKNFKGHSCAGYALEVNFSPDGRLLCSGDSGGYACFWDWKTCRMYKKFAAHNGPLSTIAFHPQETSKVVTGGWDGMIHYWD